MNVNGYRRYPRKDYPHHDIKLFRNYNRQACGKQCNNIPQCKAFVFNIKNKNCWVKKEGKPFGRNFKNHNDAELFITKYKRNIFQMYNIFIEITFFHL